MSVDIKAIIALLRKQITVRTFLVYKNKLENKLGSE
jgi:hypothetical protein